MKWNNENTAKLRRLCTEGVSNKDIASELGFTIPEIHAKRSALGITIPKVKAGALEDKSRTKADIEAEIKKVQQAATEAHKKSLKCANRLTELWKELKEA